MTASRRLHLAAKGSATICVALRRWRRQAEASDFGQPTAAMTRWRISVLPSSPLPVAGVGRPRFWERARYFNEDQRLAAALDQLEEAGTSHAL